MRSRIVFKVLLIILLILLATPLLGALAMMASGNSMMAQMPSMMDGRMMGLATIWIALILLLIVVAIVSIGRSMRKRGTGERDKAA
jgi:preprotein translocase subunit SecG